MRTLLRRYAMLSVLAIVVAMLPLAVSAAPGSAGGNSDAAHACQNGGFQTLYRMDGTGFKNVGDCVSYAAHGGQFQTATLSIVFDTANQVANFTGSGLQPGSDVTIHVTYPNSPPADQVIGQAGADGTFSFSLGYACNFFSTVTTTGTAANGTPVTSPTVNAPC